MNIQTNVKTIREILNVFAKVSEKRRAGNQDSITVREGRLQFDTPHVSIDASVDKAANGASMIGKTIEFTALRNALKGAKSATSVAIRGEYTSAEIDVTIGTKRVTIPCVAVPTFERESVLCNPVAELNASALVDGLKRSIKFAGKKDTRYYLNGVLITPATLNGESSASLVATDGHRLSMIPLDTKCYNISHDTIIPIDVSMALAAMGRATGTAFLQVATEKNEDPSTVDIRNATGIAARVSIDTAAANYCVWFKPICGKYPDYKRAIPTDYQPMNLPSGAVSAISAIGSDPGKFVISNGSMEWITNDSRETIAIASETLAPTITIGFQGNYIADAFKACKGDAIMGFIDEKCSTIILSGRDIFVVSPMRL